MDWTIKYNGIVPVYNQTQHSRFSKNGLTGCLSFHDIEILYRESTDLSIGLCLVIYIIGTLKLYARQMLPTFQKYE